MEVAGSHLTHSERIVMLGNMHRSPSIFKSYPDQLSNKRFNMINNDVQQASRILTHMFVMRTVLNAIAIL